MNTNPIKEDKKVKFNKIIVLSALGSLLVLALGACAAPPAPITIDGVPVYSSAKASNDAALVQVGNNTAAAIKNSLGDKAASIDSKVFTAPKDAQWSDVEKFYDGQAGSSGWTTNPSLSTSQGAVNGKGWTRGQQILIVYLNTDPALAEHLLIVILVSVKS